MTQPLPKPDEVPGAAGPDVGRGPVVELVKAEIRQELIKSRKVAGMYSGAALACYMVALFASVAVWWALGTAINWGWSAVIVLVIWAIIGTVLYSMARRESRDVTPAPASTARDGAHRKAPDVAGHLQNAAERVTQQFRRDDS